MSFLNGVLKSVINPVTLLQVAMGPAGWASIAIKAAVSAIGKQAIQAIGEKVGLPQSVINAAQTAFGAATGTQSGPRTIREAVSQLAERFNLSPTQQGNLTRSFESDLSQILGKMATPKSIKDAQSAGPKSWIMALAEALGKVADELSNEMTTMAEGLGGPRDKDGKVIPMPKNATQQEIKADSDTKASDNLKFGAKSQEFAQFFSAANTAIKTLGEALATGARKS